MTNLPTQTDILSQIVVAVRQEASKVASDSTNNMSSKDALEIADAIATNPVILNATNSEAHWWQKRSRWSAIVSAVAVIAAPLAIRYGIDLSPAVQEEIVHIITTIGGLVAGYLAYRAGIATKPLGTKE